MITAENLTSKVTEEGYTILLDGTPWIVQKNYIPYRGKTMRESAQNHINEILTEQTRIKEAENQPSQIDILGQTVAKLTLENMQLNKTVDTLTSQIKTLKGDKK